MDNKNEKIPIKVKGSWDIPFATKTSIRTYIEYIIKLDNFHHISRVPFLSLLFLSVMENFNVMI
jgi:hypothetical protein